MWIVDLKYENTLLISKFRMIQVSPLRGAGKLFPSLIMQINNFTSP